MNKKTELTIIKESETFIEIKDNSDLEKATTLLSRLNKYLDGLTEEKEKVTKPMLLALKNERARFKPLEEKLENAINKIRNELSRYATKIEAEKLRISNRVGSGTGHLKVETAIEKIENIAIPDTVEAENGTLKFRPHQVLKITNIDRIPRAFMVVNERKLLEALKRGDEIEGAELETIQIPVNSR